MYMPPLNSILLLVGQIRIGAPSCSHREKGYFTFGWKFDNDVILHILIN